MMDFVVFKQGRERCAALTDIISDSKSRVTLLRISDAVKLALSLSASGIQQDGGNNNCSQHMGVCGHCLGNIRGQCCAACRHIESQARKAFQESSRYCDLTERDDIFLTAAVIFDFMKVHHGWSNFDWTEDILKKIESYKLQRLFEELDNTINIKSNGLDLHSILKNTMISIGHNGVHVWSPTLIKNIFEDRLSAIMSTDESPSTPMQCPTENDINMLFSEEKLDVNLLFDDSEYDEYKENQYDLKRQRKLATCDSGFYIDDEHATRAPSHFTQDEGNQENKCSERVLVDQKTLKPKTSIFKHMQRTKQYRNFIKNTILLPVKKKFKDPMHCTFLDNFLQIEFEFKFDTSNYDPKKMISQLLYTDRFLNFIKSIVPKKTDSLDKAFYFVNQNLLIKK